ncbi:hypothetical protein ACIPIC_05055 [Streptomyces collinus]|uniref:hypothetical protein n=1 Tax=Streptomyces collinus TaxID=42684 RepID=UPI0038099DDE
MRLLPHDVVPHSKLQKWRIASCHSLLVCCVMLLTLPVSPLSAVESELVVAIHA